MSHDLETAQLLKERQVNKCADEYFEFVKKQLQHLLAEANFYEIQFLKTGDFHSIEKLSEVISTTDFGFRRAIHLVHRLGIIEEEVLILEEIEREKIENALSEVDELSSQRINKHSA